MESLIKPEEWKPVFRFLRTIKGLHTQKEQRVRPFLEGVAFILRSGAQWRLLPAH